MSRGTRTVRIGLAILLGTTMLRPGLAAAQATPSLEQGFASPPASARPRVWWHWMNGNISKDGIQKDLDWMKGIGIGGLQAFDANLSTPKIVQDKLAYMTPPWKDAFRFSASLADRLGLELAIASSPGWSETGGPWVRPEDAMTKIVWSETVARGGKRIRGPLPPLPAVTGPFQTLPISAAMMGGGGAKPILAPARDIAVLAYPVSAPPLPVPHATIAGGQAADGAALADGKADTAVALPVNTGLILAFDAPVTVRSATMFIPNAKGPLGDIQATPRLEASVDGKTWTVVGTMPADIVPTTIGFAPITAKLFRLVVSGADTKPNPVGDPAPGAMGGGIPALPPPKSFRVAEFRVSSERKVDRFETKAGFSTARDYYALTGDGVVQGVPASRVIDLGDRMKPDGSIDWTPPKGLWRIVRLGSSLTGMTNHPATKEATGLEVDKYDAAAVRRYMETYLAMYRQTVGSDLIGAHGIKALVTDSTEVGASNWTPRMIAQFRRLRGYDPTPWLPVLTGAVIGSTVRSDAFLYDYRRTLADLMASEHYGTIADVAHRNALTVYGEALEDGRPLLGDDEAMRSHADVPMAAMWTYARGAGPRPTYIADDKGASSVAHLYGRPFVAAESLTSVFAPWAYGPADLRRFIDLEFALGINRPVIHTSVHQPVDKAPGLSLFIVGQFFNRLESWADLAAPWVDYMSRSSFLLQQGVDIADVAYFYGEEAPLTGLYAEAPVADAPSRYAYDFVNSDALDTQLSVDRGDLVARGGARYRLLFLGGSSRRMTLSTLRRIAALVDQGATVVGEAPQGSPSLADDAAAFEALVSTLWSSSKVTLVGKGRVIAGRTVEAALGQIGVAPDFSYRGAPDARLLFVHRRLPDGDIYFVDNRQDRAESVEARFRVSGRLPELWHADTGRIEPVSYRIEGDETIVPLAMAAEESVFVVFTKTATSPSLIVAKPGLDTVATLDGSWRVAFQPDRGAPDAITLPRLGSLSEQADPGVKYFSGVATYTKSFSLPRTTMPGTPLLLDLGAVGTIADVRLNGRKIGGAWHAPYRLDIGSAAKPGRNMIEIRVADLWVNRLIGDAQPGARKISFTTIPTYRADAPLRPSGLIGPVRIMAVH